MKYRRADPHQSRCEQDHGERPCPSKQNQTNQREAHAHRERKRLRMTVGVDAHQGLQQGGGHLKGQRDEPHLSVLKIERLLQQRINRRDKRLDEIIEQVRKT